MGKINKQPGTPKNYSYWAVGAFDIDASDSKLFSMQIHYIGFE